MQVPPSIGQENSFCLKWVQNTTVSKCYGCNQAIHNPPRNEVEGLIVVYRDYRCYYYNGTMRWSSSPENIHFHLDKRCIQLRYPRFLPNTLVVPPDYIPYLHEQQNLSSLMSLVSQLFRTDSVLFLYVGLKLSPILVYVFNHIF